ncbi:hypothetical protein BC826DRAFT_562903 [Russula brevipes]|nr:hypothetical protein BC826DRAFT_562903 [Russula brevipes]
MNETELRAVKNFLTVVKVLHFSDGVKFWNILANLDFDWKLISRRSSLTWPGALYLASRGSSIACVVATMVGINISSHIDCQAWISTAYVFPLLELELAMLPIVVRVIAIWNRSTPVIALATITLLAHVGASVHLWTGVHSFWDPGVGYKGCVAHAPRMHLVWMSIATIAAYAILLSMVLIGLMRQLQEHSFRIVKILSQQGWAWFAFAVAAEVPILILVVLNYNYSLNLLFQIPRVVIASIGTTAVFRALNNYPGRRYGSHPFKVTVHTAPSGFTDETTTSNEDSEL